jgi:hypothetical protein
MTLRSSRALGASTINAAAHAPQKRNPSGFSWPQLGQVSTAKAYDGRSPIAAGVDPSPLNLR